MIILIFLCKFHPTNEGSQMWPLSSAVWKVGYDPPAHVSMCRSWTLSDTDVWTHSEMQLNNLWADVWSRTARVLHPLSPQLETTRTDRDITSDIRSVPNLVSCLAVYIGSIVIEMGPHHQAAAPHGTQTLEWNIQETWFIIDFNRVWHYSCCKANDVMLWDKLKTHSVVYIKLYIYRELNEMYMYVVAVSYVAWCIFQLIQSLMLVMLIWQMFN